MFTFAYFLLQTFLLYWTQTSLLLCPTKTIFSSNCSTGNHYLTHPFLPWAVGLYNTGDTSNNHRLWVHGNCTEKTVTVPPPTPGHCSNQTTGQSCKDFKIFSIIWMIIHLLNQKLSWTSMHWFCTLLECSYRHGWSACFCVVWLYDPVIMLYLLVTNNFS